MLKNEKGFTLIEMMIVLLVISVLLFITIPNVTNQSNSINSKGCEAFVHMVEGQVEAYKMDGNALPVTIDTLVTDGYLNENYKACPDGSAITIDAEGKVTSN
ncbi:competence type IV pilus major pilin ComGC [Rossellomorea aquimaris]|jgi:competence protein ComGC|uniref:ComG operon protein 3 n=1 Tax=Rossellomorea aquimaris TaxID=189382 RepID=A0A5D4TU23_9BACI|nr:competence type IV pilus major pilin ComGC [Rossellomorea aquimaris]TYS77576.1 prepilin-type N-terminal cleavage/methylation domain-containing protein [Rossellomorea aquimaris]TYS86758.1 prepilin-type N-terminal cleavage/methylation domain-containing protein [Rossellomorea aquimaris]WRP05246.1 competence type IV pilus major pilin ComGC [Rossellomorea aquimaris]